MDCSDIISLIVVELATDLAKHQGFPSEPARCINLEVDCAADGKVRNLTATSRMQMLSRWSLCHRRLKASDSQLTKARNCPMLSP